MIQFALVWLIPFINIHLNLNFIILPRIRKYTSSKMASSSEDNVCTIAQARCLSDAKHAAQVQECMFQLGITEADLMRHIETDPEYANNQYEDDQTQESTTGNELKQNQPRDNHIIKTQADNE